MINSLKNHVVKILPRYAETDQMGIIHHSNYLIYMEQARLHWLNALGFSYSKMEENGVILPVHKIDITYKKPIKFDDEIHVRISLKSIPTTRVIFIYEISNQRGEICAICELILVFTDAKTFRPRKPLVDFVNRCEKLFE